MPNLRMLTLTFCLSCMTSGGIAQAVSLNAINTAPQPDAAILAFAPGFHKIEGMNTVGDPYTHNEGIVIRGSRVENGKIIIPPGGLYYTNRGPRSYLLRGDVLNLLGHPYYLVYTKTHMGVLTDKAMKPGDEYRILPDKVLRLIEIKAKGNGHPTPVARFEVLRPSGVQVGGLGSLSTTPLSNDVSSFALSGKKTGVYDLDASFRFDQHNYTTSLDAGAGKSIKVRDLTDEGLFLEEAVFHGADFLYLSKIAPVTGYYGTGDQVKLGDFAVDVLNVNEKVGTAQVRITSKDGKSVERTLGPLDDRTFALLTNSEWDARERLSLRDSDDNAHVQVEMSPYRRQGLFRNGKVALNLYGDLVKFTPGMPWPTNKAYVYRPDT